MFIGRDRFLLAASNVFWDFFGQQIWTYDIMHNGCLVLLGVSPNVGLFWPADLEPTANGCLVSPNVGLFWPVDLELTGVLSPKNDRT